MGDRRNSATTIVITIFLFLCFYLGLTAQERINPADAGKHVGKKTTVCGQVASTNFAVGSRGRPTFLNLDREYPNQIFTALIWEADRSKFSTSPEKAYSDKKICVTGTVSSYQGKPQIVVKNPSQITLE